MKLSAVMISLSLNFWMTPSRLATAGLTNAPKRTGRILTRKEQTLHPLVKDSIICSWAGSWSATRNGNSFTVWWLDQRCPTFVILLNVQTAHITPAGRLILNAALPRIIGDAV